ncbi:apolipoprotein N-acyltransferase [Marinibactrum halimedae]|uniref:Apolipoprotein N-acyltransferase n=1 Tax=Marinibactrum halimedae TaxID=1444977 RepID=A0AA37T5G1_9GAMM|nr:apolipoprotein N-acyltransferase [Marinibactrum halimedae]MCD9457406.1 apolipoprotein N-acyltransferase [Marinibactrum halimedae]GLS25543.1 apolipoprotein N-acyltransferase [Marinibactrum halimedae]
MTAPAHSHSLGTGNIASNKATNLKYLAINTIAGAATPLALAPWNWWPVAILSLAVLSLTLRNVTGRHAFFRTLAFGLGMFGTGASWVFVSIHTFGMTSLPLAIVMTTLFVAFLALVFALPYLLLPRFTPNVTLGMLITFPVFWSITEWLRSWLLTGFPWLYVGYGHLNSPLSGFAPVGGVLLIGFGVAFSAAVLAFGIDLFLRRKADNNETIHKKAFALASSALLGVWVAGYELSKQEWTTPYRDAISVGIVQANIPQELKWAPEFREETYNRYREMTQTLWENDWVIWPEAAIPELYQQAIPFLDEFHHKAAASNTTLITGVLTLSPSRDSARNSITALGTGLGIYHKTRLVPFGEYVPLEEWLRGAIAFFDLPTSVISRGPEGQRGLQSGAVMLSPSICYEVVYPTLVSQSAKDAQVLITISNDAWFGHSIGPLQHMQMAQMRALETGRPLIRATNNGISALVDSRGQFIAQTPQFVQETLSGTLQPMTGHTPFMSWENEPLLALLLAGLLITGTMQLRKKRQSKKAIPV